VSHAKDLQCSTRAASDGRREPEGVNEANVTLVSRLARPSASPLAPWSANIGGLRITPGMEDGGELHYRLLAGRARDKMVEEFVEGS